MVDKKPKLVIGQDGVQSWYLNGQLHRLDGPARIFTDGSEEWHREDQLHRDDGPAVVNVGSYSAWCQNGELHREDGPAVIFVDGRLEWWLSSREYNFDIWLIVVPVSKEKKLMLKLEYG